MDERTAQVIRDELNATRRYICSYCKKEFIYKAVFKRHQTKCIADTVSKPLSKPTATLTQPAVSEDLLKVIAEDMAKPYESQTGAPWPGPRPKAETHTPAPTVQIDVKAKDIADMMAKLPAPPATGSPTTSAPHPTVSRKVDAVYYLLVGILSLLALCLMVAAALGIKMLVGW